MTQEQIIIKDYFVRIKDSQVDNTFISIYESYSFYSAEIVKLFAFYHQKLNFELKNLNWCIRNKGRLNANDSRNLIDAIDDVFSFQNDLFKTRYGFDIAKRYYLYLKSVREVLQPRFGTEFNNNLSPVTLIKFDRVFILRIDKEAFIKVDDDVNKILALVSTRNAAFDEMTDDEKLGNINNAISYFLKEDNKYHKLDCLQLFSNYISEDDIKRFRKETHCFRHGEKQCLEERKTFTAEKKRFYINYGLTICMVLSSLITEK